MIFSIPLVVISCVVDLGMSEIVTVGLEKYAGFVDTPSISINRLSFYPHD